MRLVTSVLGQSSHSSASAKQEFFLAGLHPRESGVHHGPGRRTPDIPILPVSSKNALPRQFPSSFKHCSLPTQRPNSWNLSLLEYCPRFYYNRQVERSYVYR